MEDVFNLTAEQLLLQDTHSEEALQITANLFSLFLTKIICCSPSAEFPG